MTYSPYVRLINRRFVASAASILLASTVFTVLPAGAVNDDSGDHLRVCVDWDTKNVMFSKHWEQCPSRTAELSLQRSGPASKGVQMITGVGAPPDSVGDTGNYYFDVQTAVVYGPKGDLSWGDLSAQAQTLTSSTGFKFLRGTSSPIASSGSIGDMFFNETTKELYGPKTSDGWGVGVSLRGPKGDTGNTGPQGAAGSDGSDGKSAFQVAIDNGFSGTESQWLASLIGATGARGAQGPKGDTGNTGPQGAAGTDGSDGKSAFQVAIDNGFSGTESQWLASLIGATGSQGPKGDTGSTGAQGPQGPVGPQGAQGPAGSDGADGKNVAQSVIPTGFSQPVAILDLLPETFDGVTTNVDRNRKDMIVSFSWLNNSGSNATFSSQPEFWITLYDTDGYICGDDLNSTYAIDIGTVTQLSSNASTWNDGQVLDFRYKLENILANKALAGCTPAAYELEMQASTPGTTRPNTENFPVVGFHASAIAPNGNIPTADVAGK